MTSVSSNISAQRSSAPQTNSKGPNSKGPARKAIKPKRPSWTTRLRARMPGVRFRVLPLMIFVAILLLGVRTGEMWRIVTRNGQLPAFPTSLAQEAQKPASPGNAGAPASPTAPEPPPMTPAIAAPDPSAVTPGAPELAQHYAERRVEIERQTKELEQREALLVATEKRLDQKLQELEKVRTDIQKMMRAGDEKQNAQVESLVKIYETMKPKEAARIFEELDMPVLLDVFQRIKEPKAAPILAAMDPVKAKQVTSAMIERRTMPALSQ